MPKTKKTIRSIRINRLKGRVSRIPSKTSSKKRFLYVYGSHSSIERNYGIALALSNYGEVTFPDLPGFGGMDSFYSQGMEASIDNLADYLAAFIRLEYGDRKKFSVFGFSLGFHIVARMLEKYPELTKRVELCISLGGITSKKEFRFGPERTKWQRRTAWLLSHKIPSTIYRYSFLSTIWIRLTYAHSILAKAKFIGMNRSEKRQALGQEVVLWHSNDVRTWAKTIHELLISDLSYARIDKRLWHIDIVGDQYLDNAKAISNLKDVFKSVRVYRLALESPSPVMIDTEEKGLQMIPTKLQNDLTKFALGK